VVVFVFEPVFEFVFVLGERRAASGWRFSAR
jgi:hypothetical protein